MTSEIVAPHQTVLVRDGRIVVVGPAEKVKLPPGTERIRGRGKYLMPGLADMHVHIVDPGLKQFDASIETDGTEFTPLFPANGVTTVRSMWGSPEILLLKKRILNGDVLGPYIYSAGPITDGEPPRWPGSRVVKTPEQAIAAVASDKRSGFSGIKVYSRLTADVYAAIVSAAKDQGLPVFGHVPQAVGLMGVLKAHQDSIEHLDGYPDALQADDSPFKMKNALPGKFKINYIDLGKLPAIVEATRAAGVWNCPTIVVWQGASIRPEQFPARRARVEMRYLRPWLVSGWDPKNHHSAQSHEPGYYPGFEKRAEVSKVITKALHDGGARLLLGTDTPNPFVIPGFSVHEELPNFVDAGLTPYQALKAATSDAAEFLNQRDEFGTVAVGRRADLLLLEGNPLSDIRNATRRAGVMVRGRWLTESDLQDKLERLARSNR